jgi:DNA-binding IclR family transcriptional regulator
MAGNAGRVLVAWLSAEECAPFLAGKSAAERAALKREFSSVRKVGYVITQNEIVMGATAIASPVFDATRNVVASLAVLGPTARVSREQAAKYAPWVRQAAEQLSAQLGRDIARYMT